MRHHGGMQLCGLPVSNAPDYGMIGVHPLGSMPLAMTTSLELAKRSMQNLSQTGHVALLGAGSTTMVRKGALILEDAPLECETEVYYIYIERERVGTEIIPVVDT